LVLPCGWLLLCGLSCLGMWRSAACELPCAAVWPRPCAPQPPLPRLIRIGVEASKRFQKSVIIDLDSE
jgi:hypothetical protein